MLLRNFLRNVINEFQNVGINGVRFAIVQYSDNPRYNILFNVTLPYFLLEKKKLKGHKILCSASNNFLLEIFDSFLFKNRLLRLKTAYNQCCAVS